RVLASGGLPGVINALALSPDGNWLAVGGRGVARGEADFRHPGIVFPQIGTLDDDMRQDQGMVYVFHTGPGRSRPRLVRLLRGHRGPVLGLAFAPSVQGKPYLISAAREWKAKAGKFAGVVRLWDVDQMRCLATLDEGLPSIPQKPGLAAWPV